MLKNIRNLIVGLMAAASLVAVPLAVPALVSADNISNCLSAGTDVNNPTLGQAANGSDCTASSSQTTAPDKINNLIKTVVNVFSIVVGIVAVVMIILGGLRYITSGGDSGNVTNAKNTIIYAIIGLVVVALAQFIVQFVLNKVTQ